VYNTRPAGDVSPADPNAGIFVEAFEVTMTSMLEDEKPWKVDLARKAAQRRETALVEIEEAIKQAGSFEESLRLSVESLKKKFARYAAVTAYAADGEDLAVHVSIGRPEGPERVSSATGPVADAAKGQAASMFSSIDGDSSWATVGLTTGSVLVVPVRTAAGLWAIIEIWSDFRDAFTPADVRLANRIGAALAAKTPAA
jgi:GAF domain-containing protein